ncbi:MAG: methyltransferase [Clostridiales bacterium]|nr:methyltransferase [Clostridiales bacterium]
MSHYYSPDAELPHEPGSVILTISERTLVFATDAGVFGRREVDYGSRLLIRAMLAASPPVEGRILDIGCGYGPIGLTLAALRPGVEVVLTDVNRRALALTAINARTLDVTASVVDSDGFAAVDGLFDHIATNPPVRAGKSVYYPWFAQAPRYLRPGGSFWCVVQRKQGASSVRRALEEAFGGCSRVDLEAGYHVYRAVRKPE